MRELRGEKLNRLERLLPEGLLVDALWLSAQGYSTSLRAKYVASGWLEQPARQVYRRPRGRLDWRQVVVSLQTLLDRRLVLGGRTALETQGYAHYLAHDRPEIHLHGLKPPPGWLFALPLPETFLHHNSRPLFGEDLAEVEFPPLVPDAAEAWESGAFQEAGLRAVPWGQWDWPMTVSTPERAILELLDELPDRESFHQVDMLMEGLSDLSPQRLRRLLLRCRSVKVKRLFFFFADRHRHAWLGRLERAGIDLGSGKRSLVREGRYDPVHRITVPRDLGEAG